MTYHNTHLRNFYSFSQKMSNVYISIILSTFSQTFYKRQRKTPHVEAFPLHVLKINGQQRRLSPH